ncbi:MAG: NAD-dependent epimerase/dehydratase family protein [Saprospiraceae bacterium]|nr:NAD-dependent epimerase/dehydratase family protein [Saprospiraceae bacterium]HMW40300.1 NAD-dependent epimerase/dehydratase family protein [Saprospiraceae bacterium]HMX87738.1 NAD-dependent epimerase/dehydratase family protein [Saprospiraceae bacterium]HMZ39314.1 NAD-dependent epimerase/dehydratase family protein [Saprospiraceae bacterium]HNA63630.1 NAD-dependent epimerase/dehydratase family protein [Saprospiraceae bacterium]
MKILVSGASGFIGEYVLSALRAKGIEAVALCRTMPAQGSPGITWLIQDFGSSISSENILQISNCDRMIHLAWTGLPNYGSVAHIMDNVLPQYHFIQQILSMGIRDITITGSCLEYGMRAGAIHAEDPVDPQIPYAIAKDALHRLLRFETRKTPFRLKWVRLFYMYGAGQAASSLYSQLMEAIRNGQSEFRMSGGEQVRDFMSVEAVAEYLIDVSISESERKIFHCCSGHGTRVIDFVENLITQYHSKIKPERGYYPYPEYEPMNFYGVPTVINEN